MFSGIRMLAFIFMSLVVVVLTLGLMYFKLTSVTNNPKSSSVDGIEEIKDLVYETGETIQNGFSQKLQTSDQRKVDVTGYIKSLKVEDKSLYVDLIIPVQNRDLKATIDFGYNDTSIGVSFVDSGVVETRREWSTLEVSEIMDKLKTGYQTRITLVSYLNSDSECVSDYCQYLRSEVDEYKEDLSLIDTYVWGEVSIEQINEIFAEDKILKLGAVSQIIIEK